MKVWIDGQATKVDPKSLFGAGGEAEVFDLGTGEVLKLFKTPDHPDLKNDPTGQKAAERRLNEHQKKLAAFPTGLPKKVVAPQRLARDKSGARVLGYTMTKVQSGLPVFKLADPGYRRAGGKPGDAAKVLLDIHSTLSDVHRSGVVVGDMNDANILFTGDQAWFIDADSYQFGAFPSSVFTARFVDPLLCDPREASPLLSKPYAWTADWYAYQVMLMRSLLCVGPYGGVFKPTDKSRRVSHGARPLHRITVFDPEVKYPKPATHWKVLPDELLETFRRTFEEDERKIFPRELVANLTYRTCSSCKLEHARSTCPVCHGSAPGKVTLMKTRGKVSAEEVFRTEGVILEATVQGGKLLVLTHEDGAYRREDGRVVLVSPLDPTLHFALRGDETVVNQGRQAVVLGAHSEAARHGVDIVDGAPSLACTADHRIWVEGGVLYRQADPGLGDQLRLGDVLTDRTRIWAGPDFGMGLYRAGRMTVVFRFDPARPGLVDDLAAPHLTGDLIDARCHFDKDQAWLLLATRAGGRISHHFRVYSKTGDLLEAKEYEPNPDAWWGHLEGKLALGKGLLSASDSGLERVEPYGGSLTVTKSFPDTEPFVDGASRLLASPLGLLVVGDQTVTALRLG